MKPIRNLNNSILIHSPKGLLGTPVQFLINAIIYQPIKQTNGNKIKTIITI